MQTAQHFFCRAWILFSRILIFSDEKFPTKDSGAKRWLSIFGTRILWCWGQIVRLNFLIDKLHKAVSVLFRCTKIRKSKPAWVRFSQSDVNGNNESSITRCCLVLPSVAEHHCVLPGSLRFTNFLPKSQKQSRLCAICQSLCCECTICPQHHHIKIQKIIRKAGYERKNIQFHDRRNPDHCDEKTHEKYVSAYQ